MTRESVGLAACLAVIGCLVPAGQARAEFPDNSAYIGVYGGGHLLMRDWDIGGPETEPDHSATAGLRLGWQIWSTLAVEAGLGWIPTADSTLLTSNVDVLYHFTKDDWAPFVSVGVGGYHSVSGEIDADFDPQFHPGVGVRGMLASWLALRIAARDFITDGHDQIGAHNLEVTVGLDIFLNPTEADRDGDGVPDSRDKCPDVPGSADAGGCPDRDGDGIADADDACPDVPGTVGAKGCSDRDGDGVADSEDKCPDMAGKAELDGCPDTDGDGVPDAEDKCPEIAGVAELGGCPDKDGDGVADHEDKCPDVAGKVEVGGCPDRDGDGVADAEDKCPDDAGEAKLGGCPDRDGDGIIDNDDKCPEVPGLVENQGCVPKDVAKFTGAIEGIQFATGKAEITKKSHRILAKTAGIMKRYETMRMRIEGHTDNVGDSEANLVLSQARADAVRDYLTGQGVAANRLEAKGYGDSKPVADNGTAKGRGKNRRIEFTIIGQ